MYGSFGNIVGRRKKLNFSKPFCMSVHLVVPHRIYYSVDSSTSKLMGRGCCTVLCSQLIYCSELHTLYLVLGKRRL